MNNAVSSWFVAAVLLSATVSEASERSSLGGYEAKDCIRAWIDSRCPGLIDAMELVDPPNGKPWIGLGFSEVRDRLINLKKEFDSEDRVLCVWVDSTEEGNQVLNASFRQSCLNDTAVASVSLYFYLDQESRVVDSHGGGGDLDYEWNLSDDRESDTCKTIEQVASDNADNRASEL